MEQNYNHVLHMEPDKVVFFADVLGFSCMVKRNLETSEKSSGLNIDFERVFLDLIERYSREYQKKFNIKFLWVSDSILISCDISNINKLVEDVDYVIHQLLCAHCAVRGAITVGYLYHEENLWGTAVIDANDLEKHIAIYPRIIISSDDFARLQLADAKKCFFKETELSEFLYYDHFDSYFGEQVQLGKQLGSTIKVYISFINDQFQSSTEDKHKRKWAYLAMHLSETIEKYSDYINDEHQHAIAQADGSVVSHLSVAEYQANLAPAVEYH